jgi:hypothetical protein
MSNGDTIPAIAVLLFKWYQTTFSIGAGVTPSIGERDQGMETECFGLGGQEFRYDARQVGAAVEQERVNQRVADGGCARR